jgi:hypothetical protein
MTDARDWLMGGGVPAVKFPAPGSTIKGTITGKPQIRQQRDFKTKDLLFFEDGQPREMLVITLATAERDPDATDDDGLRNLYVKGRNMKNAITAAVRKAGATGRGLEPGGILTVTYVRDGEPVAHGISAPKLYGAAYVPPKDDGWPAPAEEPPF